MLASRVSRSLVGCPARNARFLIFPGCLFHGLSVSLVFCCLRLSFPSVPLARFPFSLAYDLAFFAVTSFARLPFPSHLSTTPLFFMIRFNRCFPRSSMSSLLWSDQSIRGGEMMGFLSGIAHRLARLLHH